MSDKSDLKAELERKKQRLAQIREEKKRKEEERKKKEADLQQKKEPTQEDSDLDRKRRETEALLQSIGISPEPPLVQTLHFVTWDTCYFHYLVPTPMSPSSKSASTPSEAGSQDSGDLGALTSSKVCRGLLQRHEDGRGPGGGPSQASASALLAPSPRLVGVHPPLLWPCPSARERRLAGTCFQVSLSG
ncbi:cytoplasmic dynein 1 intermediate chain 1-like [Gracilinanus agilis]|uniref:cytoplasmic dynein 1 intermediate chain 1-like n=1 Tax=Gracilinanus agilis TaxID=191870 RepID=UPI001CFC9AB2|nr:cytoplasmic dynein 1 intermediate chain 1-like [Gracilinanus agilis]